MNYNIDISSILKMLSNSGCNLCDIQHMEYIVKENNVHIYDGRYHFKVIVMREQ